MSLYAVVLSEDSNGKLQTMCGSDAYVILDGRLSGQNALNSAIEHFTKRKPNARHIAVFRAQSIGHSGKVIATFPHGRENVYQPIVNQGAYK